MQRAPRTTGTSGATWSMMARTPGALRRTVGTARGGLLSKTDRSEQEGDKRHSYEILAISE